MSVVHGALTDVEGGVVTGVLSLVEGDVSVSVLVVDLGGWLPPKSQVLEANVGGGVITIGGELAHVDVGDTVSVVHGALANIEGGVGTGILGLVEGDVSVATSVVDVLVGWGPVWMVIVWVW